MQRLNRRERVPRIVFAMAIAAAVTSACTLLARFDDAAIEDDGGADATTGDASGADAPIGIDASTGDAGRDDASLDGGPYAPCKGLLTGFYCGTDGLHGYRGAPGDLVFCEAGAVGEVTPCDAGCLALSNPFPDTCNGCNTKPNGTYCGRDFAVFPGTDSDWLVQCQLGNAVQLVACAHGCLSHGSDASCAP